MRHYLDVCEVHGDEIEPVDVITFGSPCQDLSVAGKQAGLKHTGNGDEETTRSGLFMEAIRIIKEMRGATNGSKPAYAIWENVPGAFSSAKGEDFRTVIEEFARIVEPDVSIPRPPKGKWKTAGYVAGDGWSLAWRVLDAQHFGLAQRRKRVFVVADFVGGVHSGEILFESPSLYGYPAESGKAQKEAAGHPAGSVGAESGGEIVCHNATMILCDQGGSRMDVFNDKVATLRAEAHHPPIVMKSAGFCTETSAKARSNGYEEETSPTLRAGVVPGVVVLEQHPADGRIGIEPSGKCGTLTSQMGTGGNNVPLVMEPTWALQDSMIGREDENGPQGDGVNQDVSFTLNTTDRHAVCYGISSDKSNAMLSDNPNSGIYEAKTARTLDCNGGNPSCNQGGMLIAEPYSISHDTRASQLQYGISDPLTATDYKDPVAVAYGVNCRNFTETADVNGTLQAKPNGGISYNLNNVVRIEYVIRRLLPVECARLQGFPDGWGEIERKDSFTDEEFAFWQDVWLTHQRIVMGKTAKPKTREQLLKWYNGLHTDANEYKMWGNGVALPCVRLPLRGMAKLCVKTLGSLFDGSGGFPLAGRLEGIDTLWVSEIEPYPIAVTCSHL